MMNCTFGMRGFLKGIVVSWIIFLFLSSRPLMAAGSLQSVEVEALRITIDSEWSPRAAPGYWPIRFDITNLGDNRKIEIVGLGTRWWNSGESGTSEIRQSVALK